MAIVAGGLGQPESGAIVAGGLGTSEPAAPGFVNFTITVTSTATQTITAEVIGDTPVTPPTPSGGGWDRWHTPQRKPKPPRRRTTYVDALLYVSAEPSAYVTAEVTYNFDAELELLLLVGAI